MIAALALCVPLAVAAQPSAAKVYRVGFLGTASASGYLREVEWIRGGLRNFGYEEGKNLVIEWRWADSNAERMQAITREFISLKVDAILTHNAPGALAAARETASIPIVMADGSDPVTAGLTKSLAKPSRNVTGSTSFIVEEAAKRLQLMKETVPSIRLVAFLHTTHDIPANLVAKKKMLLATAQSSNVKLYDFVVKDARELPERFRDMARAKMDALVVNNEPTLNAQANVIAALSALSRLPSIGYPNFADSGGLLAYGASRSELYGRAAYFLDRIFKGAKPADIPFEQPRKFDFIVNARVAQALDIVIPPTLRLRADRVIE